MININNTRNIEYKNQQLVLLNKSNPFKNGTLHYYLIDFFIKKTKSINDLLNGWSDLITQDVVRKNRKWINNNAYSLNTLDFDMLNEEIFNFLSTKKEEFFITGWASYNIFEKALDLAVSYDVVKINKKNDGILFGVFPEDGLFDVLNEDCFTSKLGKINISDNHKMLWLSLYMNKVIRKQENIPTLKFKSKKIYGIKDSLEIEGLSYADLMQNKFSSVCFSESWFTEDWIRLSSRGLFHHIGDNVGFFFAAEKYGSCFFLGKNENNHNVVLSHKIPLKDIKLSQFEKVHPTDFDYVYGVPKGQVFNNNSTLGNLIEEAMDCKINSKENNVITNNFWDNSVFLKNAKRNIMVGSFKDKFKDILEKVKILFDKNNQITIDRLIKNELVSFELIYNIIEKYSCNSILKNRIKELSAFFVKSIANKTVCEIINPLNSLNLGFFNKNDGTEVMKKEFDIFTAILDLYNTDNFLENPLDALENYFVDTFIPNSGLVKSWIGVGKKAFVFSDLVSMENEYRIFIINGKIAATTACFRNSVPLTAWQNGRMDPRLVNGHNGQVAEVNRERVYKYARFARKFCKEMNEEYPKGKSFTLDVAWCNELNDVVPIELNSITWSGAYQVNMHRVCAAVANTPFRYNHLETFIFGKMDSWGKMIVDKIINPERFDLCGLDRTLKSNLDENKILLNYMAICKTW